MFNAVLDAVPGLSAPRCVFVDDRHSNLERAQEFGMKTVHCDCEKGGLDAVRTGLGALGVFDSTGDRLRAVVFDVGGVLAQDVWEHAYLDPAAGLVAQYPHLDHGDLSRVGKKLWEEFAYSRDLDGQMEENYYARFLSEFSWDA
jgi:FMN phosphatase YigB (HAD superfamily)